MSLASAPPGAKLVLPYFVMPIIIVGAILAAYADSLNGPFIFDDYNAVLMNPNVRSLLPLSESMSSAPGTVLNGRPLSCFSMALNYALASKVYHDGTNEPLPFGFHVFNLATHLACALLLYGLIRRTLLMPKWGGRFNDSAWLFAGSVTLIWAVHPLQTEAVTYVTQRTETLMAMFLLAVLYATARAAQSKYPIIWWTLGVIASAAGMASKEVMVVAPLLAALYGWVFLPRRENRRGEFLFLLAMMLTWVIIPYELRDANWDSKSGYGLAYVSRFDYLRTQALVIPYYLWLAIWPRGLCLDYFDWPMIKQWWPPDGSFGDKAAYLLGWLIPGVLLSVGVIASGIGCYFRRWEGFLGAWFFLILGPTSSFLPNFTEIAAERRMYLPLLSVVIFILAFAWAKLPRRPAVYLAAVGVVAAALAIGSYTRNSVYKSAISIWTDAVNKRPANPRSIFFLGLAYAEQLNWNEARICDEMALVIMPIFHPAQELRDYINLHSGDGKPPPAQPTNILTNPFVNPLGTPASPGDHPEASQPNPQG